MDGASLPEDWVFSQSSALDGDSVIESFIAQDRRAK